MAVIDLGTNSVRFDIYEIQPSFKVKKVYKEKLMIRLGDGLYRNNQFDEQTSHRVMQVFRHFRSLMKLGRVERVLAFATSAMREASNANQLITSIYRKTGIPLVVISGEVEASLIARAILKREKLPAKSHTGLIDIGGGSTEVSICFQNRIRHSYSLPLGANRLQQTFLKSIPPRKKNGLDPVFELRSHIRQIFAPLVLESHIPPCDLVLGSSGTVKAYAKIIRANGGQATPFSRKDLETWISKIESLNRDELLEIKGLEPNRIDLILAGGIILEELCRILECDKIQVTPYSLRDGMLDLELGRLGLQS